MKKQTKIFIIKVICFLASIALAIVFAKSSFFKTLLTATKGSKILGSFIAGIFVASGFTATPALVILAEIAQKGSVYQTALIGGLGAFFGDLLIFWFIKNKISNSLMYTLENLKTKKFARFFKSKIFKPIMVTLGAFFIASPLPDELGLTLMGIAQMNTFHFFVLIFTLHTIGIFIAGSIAHGT